VAGHRIVQRSLLPAGLKERLVLPAWMITAPVAKVCAPESDEDFQLVFDDVLVRVVQTRGHGAVSGKSR
jgi:hypothetical protein